MARLAVLFAVVCLLAGCATQSLSVAVDGAVELTVKASDLEKAYKAAKRMFPTIVKLCGHGLEMPGYGSQEKFNFTDIIPVVGQLRDLINAQTLTLKGQCLPEPMRSNGQTEDVSEG